MMLLAGSSSCIIARPRASQQSLSVPRARHCVLRTQQRGLVVRAVEQDESSLTGEWPVNWSLASYEDVGEYFKTNLFKDSASPANTLEGLMSRDIKCATPEQDVSSLSVFFEKVSGVPVVKSDTDKTLVGVVSKKDLVKAGAKVKDIMSTPPVAARPTNTVADAAALMLKHKVHRIPIVDTKAVVIGMVTRTDIFNALEDLAGKNVP